MQFHYQRQYLISYVSHPISIQNLPVHKTTLIPDIRLLCTQSCICTMLHSVWGLHITCGAEGVCSMCSSTLSVWGSVSSTCIISGEMCANWNTQEKIFVSIVSSILQNNRYIVTVDLQVLTQVESYWSKTGILDVALPDVYSLGQYHDWPGVSKLLLDKTASLICNSYLSKETHDYCLSGSISDIHFATC